jgi:aspartate carbamoyltransferase regulatory subunit
MDGIILVIGGIVFLFVLFFFSKKVFRKRKQIVYAIKKVTKCKDNDCIAGYEIQGVDKSFKTFEEAKQYALFLKHGRR